MFERTDPDVWHGPLERGQNCPFGENSQCPTILWQSSKVHAKYESMIELEDGDELTYREGTAPQSAFKLKLKKVPVNPKVPPFEYGIPWIPYGFPFSMWLYYIENQTPMTLTRKDGGDYQI